MEAEFKRIYDCMRASETLINGEYFVIHADHLHDFKMAIENYLENDNKKIEKLKYSICGDLAEVPDNQELMDKINEIINKINRLGV